jgi:putative aldouronate transport system permease protein
MAAPAVIWLVLFSYIPMGGLLIAFKDYRNNLGFLGSQWVGWRNFTYLFATEAARQITFNTLFMNALFILTTLVASLGVAILLYQIQHHFFARFYQSALFFPYFISYVIVSAFVFAFLSTSDGVINRLFASVGREPVEWYSRPEYWPAILTLINLWKGVGFWSIVYFAGILAINPEFFEAARVDGATGWQVTLHITLPLLMPLIIINLLLSIGRIFYADFGLFYQVTRNQGLLYKTTNVIDTYVFRSLKTTGDIGMASAAGFYQAVIGFLLVLGSNLLVRKIDKEKALF